jgi:hypothetical protein
LSAAKTHRSYPQAQVHVEPPVMGFTALNPSDTACSDHGQLNARRRTQRRPVKLRLFRSVSAGVSRLTTTGRDGTADQQAIAD